jgi:hypothetical protein
VLLVCLAVKNAIVTRVVSTVQQDSTLTPFRNSVFLVEISVDSVILLQIRVCPVFPDLVCKVEFVKLVSLLTVIYAKLNN